MVKSPQEVHNPKNVLPIVINLSESSDHWQITPKALVKRLRLKVVQTLHQISNGIVKSGLFGNISIQHMLFGKYRINA